MRHLQVQELQYIPKWGCPPKYGQQREKYISNFFYSKYEMCFIFLSY